MKYFLSESRHCAIFVCYSPFSLLLLGWASAVYSFYALLSITQYKHASSMRFSVRTAQYKGGFALSHELPVCPVKVPPNLPIELCNYQGRDRQENAN